MLRNVTFFALTCYTQPYHHRLDSPPSGHGPCPAELPQESFIRQGCPAERFGRCLKLHHTVFELFDTPLCIIQTINMAATAAALDPSNGAKNTLKLENVSASFDSLLSHRQLLPNRRSPLRLLKLTLAIIITD